MTHFQSSLKDHPPFKNFKEILKLAKRLGSEGERQLVEALYERYADRHAERGELVFPAA